MYDTSTRIRVCVCVCNKGDISTTAFDIASDVYRCQSRVDR